MSVVCLGRRQRVLSAVLDAGWMLKAPFVRQESLELVCRDMQLRAKRTGAQ